MNHQWATMKQMDTNISVLDMLRINGEQRKSDMAKVVKDIMDVTV